jgi:WD40 repeat protein
MSPAQDSGAMTISAANAHRVRYHRQCGRWGHVPLMVAWNPQHPLLATGSTLDHTRVSAATVWTPDGTLAAQMPGPHELVDLSWSWDGRWLATATDRITLWNMMAESVRTLPGRRMRWSPTSYHLATYAHHAGHWQWYLWDLVHGTRRSLVLPHGVVQPRAGLAWSPSGVYLGGCWRVPHDSMLLMVWDRAGHEVARIPLPREHSSDVFGCVWHPHEHQLLLWLEAAIILVDLRSERLTVLPLQSNWGGWIDSTPYQWSPDGMILAAATGETVQLWTDSGQLHTTLRLPGEALTVAWNPAGDVLATAAWSNRIQLWTRDGDQLANLVMHQPGLGGASMQIPYVLAWDTTGHYLAASLRGCTVHLWGL